MSRADPSLVPERALITPIEVEKVVNRLTDVIRMLLLKETLPEQLQVKEIANGQLTLYDPERDEFEIILTLDANPKDGSHFWKIVSLNLHVNEPDVTVSPLHIALMQRLTRVIQFRLYEKLAPQPLVDMYKLIRMFFKTINFIYFFTLLFNFTLFFVLLFQ